MGEKWLPRVRWQKSVLSPSPLPAQYLTGKKGIRVPRERRKPNGNFLRIVGARENNLKNIDVEIPLGVFCGSNRCLRFGQEHPSQ